MTRPIQDPNIIPVNFGGQNGLMFEPHLKNINKQRLAEMEQAAKVMGIAYDPRVKAKTLCIFYEPDD